MPKYSGHAPGHVREAFGAAVDAYLDWKAGQPEPTVEYEINYVPRQIPITAACGLLWNCSDILPGMMADELVGHGLPFKRRTYASAARAMLENIKATGCGEPSRFISRAA
jgi:hypothetical protein